MTYPRFVIIESSAGETFGVTPADFRRHYEKQGFKILRWEDGEEYVPKGSGPRPLVNPQPPPTDVAGS